MSDQYTPDLKHVRRAATDFGTPITPDAFDRWLAAHDAAVLRDAARRRQSIDERTSTTSRWLFVEADRIEKGST